MDNLYISRSILSWCGMQTDDTRSLVEHGSEKSYAKKLSTAIANINIS